MTADRKSLIEVRSESQLCAWCGEPIAAKWAETTGYHPWCVEQIEADIAMEDVR